MVKSCSVSGCTNRANTKAKEKGVRFFRFPQGNHKRRSWIRALNRKDWTPTSNSYVCSEHFVSGWHDYYKSHSDYAPTIFPHKDKRDKLVDEKHNERAFRRNMSKAFKLTARQQKERENAMLQMSVKMHAYSGSEPIDGSHSRPSSRSASPIPVCDDVISFQEHKGTQCDIDPLVEENTRLREENEKLKREITKLRWGVLEIKDEDRATRI